MKKAIIILLILVATTLTAQDVTITKDGPIFKDWETALYCAAHDKEACAYLLNCLDAEHQQLVAARDAGATAGRRCMDHP